MIEREFIKSKLKEYNMRRSIESLIHNRAGVGSITFEKTPLGEKIIIDAVKPGLVIGHGGETIKKITEEMKTAFKLENPQIEVREITIPSLNALVIARTIANELETFGPKRFKPLAYRSLTRIMKAGAMGCEIKITGKIPSKRAKPWRFYVGYMKKCGYVAQNLVDYAVRIANTKAGTVGVKVKIMHPNTPLPDKVEFKTIHIEQEDLSGKTISTQEISVETAEKEIKKMEKEVSTTTESKVKKDKTLPDKKSVKVDDKEQSKAKNKKETKKTSTKPKTKSTEKKSIKKETKK